MMKRHQLFAGGILPAVAIAILLLSACGPSPGNNGNSQPTPNTNNAFKETPTQTPACGAQDDEINNKHIADGVSNDTVLNGLRLNFNWDSKSCQVSLMGYTTNEDNLKRLVAIAESAPRKIGPVERQNLYPTENPGASCPNGSKPCGDICIPTNQDCNNRPDLPTPTP
jgi:hypothetical protein